jgi:cytochrome c553
MRAIVVAAAALPALAQLDSSVPGFLARHCVACHNAKAKTAGLDLERLRDPKVALAERDAWESVADKLRSGAMPPKGAPRPDPAATAVVVAWADKHVRALDRSRRPDPGRVTARRLNRAEYNNTIRDLMGIAFRPADDFPLDDSGHGFDNIGDVLSLSPTLMEKYLAAADRVVRAALRTGPAPKPLMERYDAEKTGMAKSVPADPEGTRLVTKGGLVVRHRFPHTGAYELRLAVRGRGVPDAPPSPLAIIVNGKVVETAPVEVGQNKKRLWEVRVEVPAGEGELGGAFVWPGADAHPRPANAAAFDPAIDAFYVDSLELRGPFVDPALPDSHNRVFVCSPAQPGRFDYDCARRILGGFLARAWRRPIAPAEIDAMLGFVRMAEKEGDTFEQGVALAVKAALVSPNFLFRIERDPTGAEPRRLSGPELASRLSYFLWSSMPDEELLRADLARPDSLAVQVRRMLADPKSRALAENFAGQWLEIRNLDTATPDTRRFKEWDADLREAMRRETTLFFAEMVRENRDIRDFADGRFTYLNERLASHYGIVGVEGRGFRRVELSGDQRGGILTHASVLTVTSYPTRTSPVQRGIWVLENFLGNKIPPPPANVPNLQVAEVGKTLSLRGQMEQHRADPACAVCHEKMDSLGFGLENYDAVGGWRTHDGKIPVDSAGVAPGGKPFATPAEMRRILREDADSLARNLVEKLLTYALGRGLESYDRPAVRAIADKAAAGGYRFGTIILEIAASQPFQQRRGQRAKP